MAITALQLRANVYRVLAEVLETGIPVDIDCAGRRLRIIEVGAAGRLDRLVRRTDVVTGDSEDLAHLDWSGEQSRNDP